MQLPVPARMQTVGWTALETPADRPRRREPSRRTSPPLRGTRRSSCLFAGHLSAQATARSSRRAFREARRAAVEPNCCRGSPRIVQSRVKPDVKSIEGRPSHAPRCQHPAQPCSADGRGGAALGDCVAWRRPPAPRSHGPPITCRHQKPRHAGRDLDGQLAAVQGVSRRTLGHRRPLARRRRELPRAGWKLGQVSHPARFEKRCFGRSPHSQ